MNDVIYYFLTCFKKITVFEGRSRRKEYWMFTLVNAMVSILLSIVKITAEFTDAGIIGSIVDVLALLWGIALFVPGLTVAVRRLHDTGRSGWMLLIALIPLVGGIALLVFMCQKGTDGDNRYGEDPVKTVVE